MLTVRSRPRARVNIWGSRRRTSLRPPECAVGGSGAEVLKALEVHAVDAVFLDIRMPGLDGLDVAKVLARFTAPPKVVFVTAYEPSAAKSYARCWPSECSTA